MFARSGCTLGTPIQGTFREHLGNNQRTFREHSNNFAHSGNMQCCLFGTGLLSSVYFFETADVCSSDDFQICDSINWNVVNVHRIVPANS